MVASARTFTLDGIAARDVVVEVDVGAGLPSFSIVGLPDAAVREARERVRAAIANSDFEFPQRRITVSLAPADLRKAGPGLDLAIAAALLAATGALDGAALDRTALAGELALDGAVRAVPGALAMAERARGAGIRRLAVPAESAPEALLPGLLAGGRDLRVVPIRRLADLRLLATGAEPPQPEPPPPRQQDPRQGLPDLADLRGQPALRRALEVAAAGGHGLLVLGPPGAGKSMAARRLPSIMPPLDTSERLEVLRIASACGQRVALDDVRRPFRAPHHTISTAGLVGGGNPPRPGEVTLAHRGVLFLDELGEFGRDALEALRQPLEDGEVTITRARHTTSLPCRFLLVAAANPCPCGRGESSPGCRCSPAATRRYRSRLSGALADRIDISLSVEQPAADALAGDPGEGSATVGARVAAARSRALARQGCANAELSAAGVRRHARPTREARAALAAGHRALGLSGRGHDRVLRVARTLADLAARERPDADDVAAALALRRRAED